MCRQTLIYQQCVGLGVKEVCLGGGGGGVQTSCVKTAKPVARLHIFVGCSRLMMFFEVHRYTFKGSNFAIFILPPFSIGFNSRESKFFPIRVDSFWKGFVVQGSKLKVRESSKK